MLQVTYKLGVHFLHELFYVSLQSIPLLDELGNLLGQGLLLLVIDLRLGLELAISLSLLLLELEHLLLQRYVLCFELPE